MNTALILIASGILIGAGIAIIWRDIQKKRRGGFVSQREHRSRSTPSWRSPSRTARRRMARRRQDTPQP